MEIKAALCRRHGADNGSGQWVCVEEAFCGWTGGGQGIDLLAIGAWQTAKAAGLQGAGKRPATYPLVAYEIKCSRSDFRRELYGYAPGPNASRWRSRPVYPWPAKAHLALERTHYFMFAVPEGLLRDEEIAQREPQDDRTLWIPPEAGLLEVKDGGGCHVRVQAQARTPRPLNVREIASLIRHALNPARERRLREECQRLRRDNDWLLSERVPKVPA